MLFTGMWTVAESVTGRGTLATSITEFDDVSKSAHDHKAEANCLTQSNELVLVRCATRYFVF
jgi:hypothetical protein